MNLSLEGKIAIVTGGSKGIGKATALSLAHEGVDVVICARGITDLEDTAAEIRSTTNRKVLPLQSYRHGRPGGHQKNGGGRCN